MSDKPDLEKLAKLKEQKQKAFEKAAAELSEAIDNHDQARLAHMNPQIVEEARLHGVNPLNFENDEHLQEAIDHQKANGIVPVPASIEWEQATQEQEPVIDEPDQGVTEEPTK